MVDVRVVGSAVTITVTGGPVTVSVLGVGVTVRLETMSVNNSYERVIQGLGWPVSEPLYLGYARVGSTTKALNAAETILLQNNRIKTSAC